MSRAPRGRPELLSVSMGAGFSYLGAAVTPSSIAYQWYRTGVAIPGATSASYVVGASDVAKQLTVRVTAAYPTALGYAKVSAATAKVALGTFTGTLAGPQIISTTYDRLAAELTPGSIAEPSAKVTWQWYRNGKAVTRATSASFVLVAADATTQITVRATVTKAGYTTKALTSTSRVSGIVPSSAPAVAGDTTVGQQLTVTAPSYATEAGGALEPDVSYQWYRNGAAVPAATDDYYWVSASDFGTVVSVRVRAQYPGLVTLDQVWKAAEPTTAGVLAGTHAVPTVTGSSTLTAVLPAGSIDDEDAVYGWVWLKGGALIAGATGASYAVTAPGAYQARVTVTKPGFRPVVLQSTGVAAG